MSWRDTFAGRFGGVGAVSFLTYLGEYTSYLVVLAFISDKLTSGFGLGLFGYGLVGPISGAYLVTSGLVAVPIGHLSDKYGRRRFTVLGCLLGSAGLFMLVVADQLTDLVSFVVGMSLALTVLGIGHGTYTSSTLAYTGDIATPEEVGRPYSLVELAEFAAYAFGPAVGAAVAFTQGRATTFVLSGLILVLAALIAAGLMPEPGARGRAGTESRSESADWGVFFGLLRNPVVGATLLTTLVASIGFSAFFYYVPIYAFSLRQAIPEFAYLYALYASIMAGTGVLAMFPLGALEDRTKLRMPVLVGGLLLGSLALLAVFFSASPTTLLVASVAFGISLAMARVSQLVILGERSTFENRAAVMGTNHAVEHAGYGIGAVFGGVFVALFGLGPAFRILAVFLLLAALAFFAYARRSKVR
ncbi:MAG TPA: MFS transporter [Nitrososphaerales archaeon]|nr:MFS transporter [Nitrososphaerales archaeon]